MKKYDVVINGGGMVGAVTALLLAEQFEKNNYKIAVIESQLRTEFSHEDDNQLRVSAISKHNLDLFDQLGMLDLMVQKRMGYYHNMRVWDNHSTGELDFTDGGAQVLGAMTENNQIIATAQRKLGENPAIDVYYETTITGFEVTESTANIKLSDESELQCLLLIGADGARSKVRTDIGIETQQKPYQQKGLVCYLSIENAPEKTALQAFNAGGPVGLLPMNDGLFSVVWSLPESEVDSWLSADNERFINGIKAHINRDFGDIRLSSERQAFPLTQSYTKSLYQGRVVLIGDAAHTIHPLAGQGVNLGFGDAECLVEKLSLINLNKNDELADALKKHQRVRMSEVHKTSETMHALHHLFTNQSAPIKKLRAFGMNQLNKINLIKHWLLKQAGS